MNPGYSPARFREFLFFVFYVDMQNSSVNLRIRYSLKATLSHNRAYANGPRWNSWIPSEWLCILHPMGKHEPPQQRPQERLRRLSCMCITIRLNNKRSKQLQVEDLRRNVFHPTQWWHCGIIQSQEVPFGLVCRPTFLREAVLDGLSAYFVLNGLLCCPSPKAVNQNAKSVPSLKDTWSLRIQKFNLI